MTPLNVIFPWQGNHADIPSGWSRETTLDGKYPKSYGDVVAPNETGGNSTHTHTSTAHSHTLNSHTHTFTTSTVNSNGQTAAGDGDNFRPSHWHTGTTGASNSGGLSSETSTYASLSNDPPYYTVIYIKSTGGAIADNTIAYFNDTTAPTNWYFCDGNNSTPDLRNKYLKGAGTGANAGSTGGTTTNVHTLTHTHSVTAHGHANSTTGAATGYENDEQNTTPAADSVHKGHTHTAYVTNNTDTLVAGNPSITCSETVEPSYHKLLPIQKKTGGAKAKGIIGLWLGSTASIPAGWLLCDGTKSTPDLKDKFIKCANTTAEIGDTGGSNTHTHAAITHTHTANSHTHSMTVSAHDTGLLTAQTAGLSNYALNKSSNHAGFTSGSITATYANANTTADSSNNEPEYRTAAYIQFDSDLGGSFLFNFI